MTATIEQMTEHLPKDDLPTLACGPEQAIVKLRAAQADWQLRPFQERLKIVGQVAGIVAQRADELARDVYRPAATLGEIMASELLPLAEACRYTSKRGSEILKPKKLRQRDRAWWMGSISVTELRDPLGLVLIIAPSNYPLFLPGVQLIQALAAGNAVIVKPAPGCEEAMRSLIQLTASAGVPTDLLLQIDSDPRAVGEILATSEQSVDKVLFTGSLTTGRKVAALCAERMIPYSMELSGNDAVLVCDDADLSRVAQCVAYGLSLNGSQTCIAPRRLFATSNTLSRLIPLLKEQLEQTPFRAISQRGLDFARTLIERSIADGVSIASGSLEHFQDAQRVRPIVLANVRSDMSLAQEDIFAPLLSLIHVSDMQEAVRQAAQSPYALGASIFGTTATAEAIAEQLPVGCVSINDVLVPTADPRVSFGGRRFSGFGLTRGLEGLRELTQLKVICTRHGRWLPHLTTKGERLAPMMRGILNLRYGTSLRQRWSGLQSLMKAGKEK